MPEAHAPAFKLGVIAVNGGPTDERIVKVACLLARQSNAALVAVHVVEIDWSLPLDSDVASGSDEAQRVLDQVEAIAEAERVRLETVLFQARDVGAAIVDEANDRTADLIILGLPYRKRFGGDFAIGSVVPYALKNALCAVMVIREPITGENRS